jgi:hypothetical protein
MRPRWPRGAGFSRRSGLSTLSPQTLFPGRAALAMRARRPHGASLSRRSGLTTLSPQPLLPGRAALAMRAGRPRDAGFSRRSGLTTLASGPGLAAFALRTWWTWQSVLAVGAVSAGFPIETVRTANVAHRDNGSIDLTEALDHGRAQLGDRRARFGRDQLAIALPFPLSIGESFAESFAKRFNQNVVALWRLQRGCF